MLFQFVLNLLDFQGNTLRVLFIITTLLFCTAMLVLKCYPGAAAMAYSIFAGAVFPVFLFLITAVHPFSDHPEGSLRLALFFEIILLILAFILSRVKMPKGIAAIGSTYILSWLFFSKLPVSFTAMSDFLYLIVPYCLILILAPGVSEMKKEREEEEKDPERKKLRLQAEFELRNRERNRTVVGNTEIYADPDGTVREARDQYGCYTKSGYDWLDENKKILSDDEMWQKGLDRFH